MIKNAPRIAVKLALGDTEIAVLQDQCSLRIIGYFSPDRADCIKLAEMLDEAEQEDSLPLITGYGQGAMGDMVAGLQMIDWQDDLFPQAAAWWLSQNGFPAQVMKAADATMDEGEN